MKKILVMLLGILLFAGCAHNPHKIDPAATMHSPWKAGEEVARYSVFEGDAFLPMLLEMDPDTTIYRVFLGKTVDGHYLVQEFFTSGEAAGNAFLIIGEVGVTNRTSIKHGNIISWYPSGEKAGECLIEYGRSVEPCLMRYKNGEKMWECGVLNGELHGKSVFWYPNGRKFIESEYVEGVPVGVGQIWDIHGNLIEEINFDQPK